MSITEIGGKKNNLKIVLAETPGFCFGVNRAMDMALKETRAYTYGPLIHNEQVVEDLESRGVRVVDPDDVRMLPDGSTVIIRSHGITSAEEKKLSDRGFRIVDATCPFVKKIHNIVKEAGDNGIPVIIVGDKAHPEVAGIRGHCSGKCFIIGDLEDVDTLPELKTAKIVAQTTYNQEKFKKIVEKIRLKCYDTSVMNTICNATQERQTEAVKIASQVDAMIVIGGRNSSNTQKLVQICKNVCEKTYFVTTAADLKQKDFIDIQSVGITAGASTPRNIIQEVLTYARTKL